MNQVLLSSKKMDYCTPQALFDRLHEIHRFTLDAAASPENAKCPTFYTEQDDGLSQSWKGHTVWCNPPYGRQVGLWVKKSFEESRDAGTKVVLFIPARPDTSYYHDYIFPYAKIEWIRGRVTFENEDGTPFLASNGKVEHAPFPSAIIVFE